MQIVLASQSPYRKSQLQNFGLKFEAVSPLVDEEALKESGPKDLKELTRFLAYQKAISLREKYPLAILIGGDQLVELDGLRLDKPGSFERAFRQLKAMQGKTHRLITSLSVAGPEYVSTFTDITHVTLKKLNDAAIESYLNQDQPFDCAGSYKIEKAGMCLIEKVESSDPSAIQGLPLISLTAGLEAVGIEIKTMWKDPK